MAFAKKIEILEKAVGNTPEIILEDSIVAKLERTNFTGSIKDRLVLEAIKEAFKNGSPEGFVEATTGNTGISLAAMSAFLGKKTIIVMPKSMSKERALLIKHYGAEVVLVEDMPTAKIQAEYLATKTRYIYLNQFENPATLRAGMKLGREFLKWCLENNFIPEVLVAGVGTGGTLAGTAKVLKSHFPKMKIYAVHPVGQIDGIGDGVDTPLLKSVKIDSWIKISREEAVKGARELAKIGLGVGLSSGANYIASKRVKKRVLTVLPDSAERYFSTELFKH